LLALVTPVVGVQAADSVPSGPLDVDSHLPLGPEAPRTRVGASRSGVRIAVIEVTAESARRSGAANVADGRSVTTLLVRARDASGTPITAPRRIRYALSGADKEAGEVELKNGLARITFVAPSGAREVRWTLMADGVTEQGRVDYLPEVRSMIAVGLVEAIVDFDRRSRGEIGRMAGLSDGLERDLRNWERHFNQGKGTIAGQASVFLKGKLKGDTSITAMFDSEKDLRQREFRDYNPDRSYPVMGDSAQRGYEAKTSDRLYVRLDQDRNYLLYGDFATGGEFSMRQGSGRIASQRIADLGQYNRSMTGIRARRDDGVGFVDAFAMRDSLRQAVEEYRGNGTSGPFAIGNYNALENSEKIEIVTRDRNNTSRILTVKALERYSDYTFEPFSGRVLLKSPLSAVDADLNPVSLRITYEVDTGGEEFWVYGFSAERELGKSARLGATWVRDDNPERPAGTGYGTTPGTGFAQVRELDSVNLSVNNDQLGSLVVEVAQSLAFAASDDLRGSAVRFDWAQGRTDERSPRGSRWDVRLYGGTADKQFVNPSSSLASGRTEYGLQGAAELGERTRVHVNGSLTEDAFSTGERGGMSVAIERDVGERTRIEAGVRHFYQRRGGVASLSALSSALVLPGQASAYGGPGLNPNGAGFWGLGIGLDPVTGQPQSAFNGSPLFSTLRAADLDVTTYMLGLRTRLSDAWSMGGELGVDQGFENDPTWFAVRSDYAYAGGRLFARIEAPTGRATAGADYAVSDTTSLYGRWEASNGLGSAYSIDEASRSKGIVVGVRRHDEEGSDVHSELRLREGMNAQELEAAAGLSNTIALNDRLSVNYLVERLEILEGSSRSALAVGGGLDFGDKTWQGTTRLEFRQLDRDRALLVDNRAQSLMGSLSLARKLSDGWTGLLRNYTLRTDDRSKAGAQQQNRLQLGAAYRPKFANPFDLLLRYENKRESNDELDSRERREVNILSTHFNWHPYRQMWLSGRLAAKDLNETLGGVEDDYRAWLASARFIYDIGERFDISVMGATLGTPQSNAREESYGLEVGFRVKDNVWLSAGHNFAGFSDRDLTGREQTEEGWYLRLRMKFD
jgi:hypothetical protein